MPQPASESAPTSNRAAEPTLLLVYHADSGRWNALWDIAHKVISPDSYPCALCALTHGAFSERSTWGAFRQRHAEGLLILHRDDFQRQYPDMSITTPCVLAREPHGTWLTMLATAEIQGLAGVDALIARLEQLIAAR